MFLLRCSRSEDEGMVPLSSLDLELLPLVLVDPNTPDPCQVGVPNDLALLDNLVGGIDAPNTPKLEVGQDTLPFILKSFQVSENTSPT